MVVRGVDIPVCQHEVRPGSDRPEDQRRSSRRKEAQTFSPKRIQSLLTSAATLQKNVHAVLFPFARSRTALPTAFKFGTRISSYSRDTTMPLAPASNALC